MEIPQSTHLSTLSLYFMTWGTLGLMFLRRPLECTTFTNSIAAIVYRPVYIESSIMIVCIFEEYGGFTNSMIKWCWVLMKAQHRSTAHKWVLPAVLPVTEQLVLSFQQYLHQKSVLVNNVIAGQRTTNTVGNIMLGPWLCVSMYVCTLKSSPWQWLSWTKCEEKALEVWAHKSPTPSNSPGFSQESSKHKENGTLFY